jgi:hypothetical protein
MSATTIPSAYSNTPPNYSAETNAQMAASYAQSNSIGKSLAWFYNQVTLNGPWDYKQQGLQYEGIGNFNYGVAGTAMGIPEQVLLRMAGLAQLKDGTSNIGWGMPLGFSPYGDDPKDQQAIKDGIKWAKDNGFSPSDFSDLASQWWEEFIDGIFDSILKFGSDIEDAVNDLFLRFRDWVAPRDPLALDLDGDGIETIGIETANTVLFDHDADGIRTGTG